MMKRKKLIKITSIVFIFLIIESIFIIIIYNLYETSKEKYFKERLNSLDINYNRIISVYGLTSKLIFEEKINNEQILSLFSEIKDSDSTKKEKIRKDLHEILQPTYKNLQQANYRQFHFYLPDNTSFFRFHKPDKYGDNLEKIRSTVIYVNTKKAYAQGFEEGRVFSGFRYVYPLFHKNNYIGGVEISPSFRAITYQIEQYDKVACEFIILKEIVTKKVGDFGICNYSDYILSNNFLNEKGDSNFPAQTKINKTSIEELKTQLIKNYNTDELLKKFNKKAVHINHHENNYIVMFYPIYNFDNEPVAHIVCFSDDNKINHIKDAFFLYFLIGFVLIFAIVSFIIFLFLSRKNIYLKNKQIEIQKAEILLKNKKFKKSKVKLARKNKELKVLNATKNKFFSIIAHDLRNPFNTILGFSSLLTKHIKSNKLEKIEQFADVISKTSEHTLNLLTNLLEWSRSQTGNLEICNKNFNVNDLISEELKILLLNANKKNITIKNKIDDKIIVLADKNMISTVIRNLISNAIKFTNYGGKIIINAEEKENHFEISVSDNGVGISKEDIHKLFCIDKNFSTHGINKEVGSGLGLILCKEFVEKNGGKIWAESQIGNGSIFKFTVQKQDYSIES